MTPCEQKPKESALAADFVDFRRPACRVRPLVACSSVSLRLVSVCAFSYDTTQRSPAFSKSLGTHRAQFQSVASNLSYHRTLIYTLPAIREPFCNCKWSGSTRMPGCYQIKGRGKLPGEASLGALRWRSLYLQTGLAGRRRPRLCLG